MAQKYVNSFGTRKVLKVGSEGYEIFGLAELEKAGFKNIARLPVSLKVLLENLLRQEDNRHVNKADIEALAKWEPKAKQEKEIAFMPARVLMQDLTGVPAVVDLAAMREAMKRLGGDPKKINPLAPVDLVIDHSVQVDFFGTADAFHKNSEIEFERNVERYAFLRWGQTAFDNFRLIPPDTGICHQVNLEYLAPVVFRAQKDGAHFAYPDTVVGTDSHTTMINGLGVVGWGVGGIEAEAALLGQPIIMVTPEVIGFRLHGRLPEGATATDLVLTVVQMLRKKGVVEKFVEFYGPGLSSLSLADRATIGNMGPEYGATIGYFPVDDETLRYLRSHRARSAPDPTGRSLRERAGHVPHRSVARSDVYRYVGARPRQRGAELGRSAPAAGPRAVDGKQKGIQRSAAVFDEERQCQQERRGADERR